MTSVPKKTVSRKQKKVSKEEAEYECKHKHKTTNWEGSTYYVCCDDCNKTLSFMKDVERKHN